ncbi:unnamed protein product [Aspergillus oryzae]|uniref:Unnamed protein product n=1 Tax=Aspergillus oryzae var. brunneus TaxID=332754 RepID=A0ABQ6LFF1_ASPOZ|nr:unnamed protein product [Aspergillus oryzae]GMF91829.1 unnamed protein product [Aspergillus oryzae]GMG55046.1 unnamed protein product [Aspergillus oryzae var. brunneus]
MRGTRPIFASHHEVLEILITTIQKAVDLTGVDVVEDRHSNKHQQSVEDVDEDFMFHEEAVVAIQIFHDTNYRPHQNQNTGHIECNHVSAPYTTCLGRCANVFLRHAQLKDDSGDHEKAEEDNLHE